MKNFFIVCSIVAISFCVAISISSEAQSERKNETVVFVSNSMWTIKFKIDSINRVSPGYRVKIINSQAVATSVNSRTNTNNAYDSPQRDLKGDIICVMEK